MDIKTYIKRKSLTEAQFAALIGVGQSAVSRYMSGKRVPEWKVLLRIVEATKGAVKPNDFLPAPVVLPPGSVDSPGA